MGSAGAGCEACSFHARVCSNPCLPRVQAGIKPPTFVLFCNDTKLFPDDYKKFIERQFRWGAWRPAPAALALHHAVSARS